MGAKLVKPEEALRIDGSKNQKAGLRAHTLSKPEWEVKFKKQKIDLLHIGQDKVVYLYSIFVHYKLINK